MTPNRRVSNEELKKILLEEQKRQYRQNDTSTTPLMHRVEAVYSRYPNIKPKECCKFLRVPYAKYCHTVRQYLYKIRKRQSKIVAGVKSPKLHAALLKGRALKSFDKELAKGVGWRESKPREGAKSGNQMLLWSDNVFGNIKWYYTTGTIHLHLKAPLTWARAKKFLCRAFYETGLIFNSKLLDPFIESFEPYSGHMTFKLGVKMPKFKITNFKESNGIIIRCDKSHPYSLEVEFRFPSWAERLELLNRQNVQTIENVSELLNALTTPKPLREDSSGMVV